MTTYLKKPINSPVMLLPVVASELRKAAGICPKRGAKVTEKDIGLYHCSLFNHVCADPPIPLLTPMSWDEQPVLNCRNTCPAYRDPRINHDWQVIQTGELLADATKLLSRLSNISRIVSVKRRGIDVGQYLANMLGVPCDIFYTNTTTLVSDSSGQKEPYSGGLTLFVEDFVLDGRDTNAMKKWLLTNHPDKVKKTKFCAVYVREGSEHHVDFFERVLPEPYFFSWGLPQSPYIQADPERLYLPGGCAIDLDTVLCSSPVETFETQEDYFRALLNLPAVNIIRDQEIPLLVTSRHISSTSVTTTWLKKHGMRVKEIAFTTEEDVTPEQAIRHKTDTFKNSRTQLLISKDRSLLDYAAGTTLKNCLDLNNHCFIYPAAI